MHLEPPSVFELWVERWRKAIDAARSHGIEEGDARLEIAPPATDEQVCQAEIALDITLPAQFRQTLLEFSRRVDFFWHLGRGKNAPGPLAGVFCGGCRWDVSRLVEDYQRVCSLSRNAFPDDVSDQIVWRDKLPFHSIACGDFISIDQSSGSVVYLGRELAGSHAHRLGRDFFDFMDRWTALGCPDDDIWERFVPSRNGYIDLHHTNAKLWCQWFGLPVPGNAFRKHG